MAKTPGALGTVTLKTLAYRQNRGLLPVENHRFDRLQAEHLAG